MAKRPGTVLHVLSQRPGLTGSGTTLDALTREAAHAGWRQHAVVGVPLSGPTAVGPVAADAIHPLVFDVPPLDFPLPGMSDVMPYRSTVFSEMSPAQLDAYRAAWAAHLETVVRTVRPDVIHVHHVWMVSALLKDVAPDVRSVVHCHGTGLRQLEKCPALAPEIVRGCARNDRFAVLHDDQRRQLTQRLDVAPERVAVVGAGYRDAVFHSRGRADEMPPRALYVGKLSRSKGLDALLDAWPRVAAADPRRELHVAGGGDGEESDALRRRIDAFPGVRYLGRLDPEDLADVMRHSTVCVLPSFYEGLPLVLVEALACGCRLVATDLPGVARGIAPHVGDRLDRVPLPAMVGVDTPAPEALPGFVAALADTVDRALRQPVTGVDPQTLQPFTWRAVFERIEPLWVG